MPRNNQSTQKRKKRKKFDDLAFSTRTHNKRKRTGAQNHQSTIHMRTDRKTTYTDQSGETKPLKTASLIHVNQGDQQPASDLLKEKFDNKNTSIPFDSPIGKVTKVNPITKSPHQAITKRTGTKVYRTAKYDQAVLFSSNKQSKQRSPSKIKRSLSSNSNFENSLQYQGIKKPESHIKFQEVHVTAKSIAEAKKQHVKNQYRRPKSQQEIMAVSSKTRTKEYNATEYVHATELFSDKPKCEWLHLIAYSIKGASFQNEIEIENLVAGTFHANTDMMFVEGQINSLVKSYPEGVTLSVKADLIPQTHVASTIYYKIKTPDYTLRVTFDAQKDIQSHVSTNDYVKHYVESKTEVNQDKKKSAKRKLSTSVSDQSLFAKSKENAGEDVPNRPTKKHRK